ncbi:hypothetical protein F444_13454 [Phytophthora nicotianae P1976]|uniref:Uncharacterized protein n=1 Tax=Phytophthora nicotianae P1976 TaxID=1317066 RepID=A0A080ZTS5_PHYNI|nr:hypothetical protein F444_13454 [Phytophthora nicotianae P1976]
MTDSITVDDAFINELVTFLDSDTLVLSGIERSIESNQVALDSGYSFDVLIASDPRFDSASGSCCSNGNENDAAVKTILREKETKRRRIYRQKLKDERDTLQAQVVGLTLALDKLKQAARDRKVMQEKAEQLMYGDKCYAGKWKTLAVWEWESLCQAQDEQKRLQAAITTHTKLVKDLQKVIYKRITKTDHESPILSQIPTMEPPDGVIYDAYIQELDLNYTQIDAVYRSLDINSMAPDITNLVKMNPADGCMNELLHVNKRVLPFAFLSTCQMFWNLAGLAHRQLDRVSYGDMEEPENTIAFKFRISTMMDTGAIVSMRKRFVARRYFKSDCFVYIWKIFVEGEGVFKGLHSEESGWCRLQPSASQG